MLYHDDPLFLYLKARNPSSVIILSFGDPVPVKEFEKAHAGVSFKWIRRATSYEQLRDLGRFDLALLVDQLEHISRRAAALLLGRLRNQHTHQICIEIAEDINKARKTKDRWSETDFIASGLSRYQRFERDGRGFRLYTYDIDSYNPEREWNNPKDWANPENFDKYRW